MTRIATKIINGVKYDVALMPCSHIEVSQGPGTCKDGTKFEYINGTETYSLSHQRYKAIDVCGGDRLVYAPFDMKCKYHRKKGTAFISVFCSVNKVYCADGSLNYITMALVHGGETIEIEHESESYLKEAVVIKQGNLCYKQGYDGLQDSTQIHFHMNAKKGEFTSASEIDSLLRLEFQNGDLSADVYAMNNDACVEDIFYKLDTDNVSYTSTGQVWRNHIQFKTYTGATELNGWVDNGGTWYFYKNAVKVKGWMTEGGAWFNLDYDTGAMYTGWAADGEKWYYLNPANGHMVTEWFWDENYQAWYYFNPNNGGAMQIYWLSDGGKKYYLGSDGKMYKDRRERIDGVWYTFDNSGVATQG